MPNSIDFYKGIFLHVIPVRIIVPWSKDHYAKFQKRLMSEFQATLVSDRPNADGQAWIYRTLPAKVLIPTRTPKLIK